MESHVAARLEISIPAYSKIETGITDINISRLNQIATLFEVRAYDILCLPSDNLITVSIHELSQCKNELADARQEISSLQKRLIHVYDETRHLLHSAKADKST